MSRSLIIADLQSHSLGGHFGLWMERTIKEASKHFDSLHIYVADEISKPNQQFCGELDARKITVTLIPSIYKKKKYIGDILGVIADHSLSVNPQLSASPIFLMWAQQYLERDLIFPPLSSRLPWRKTSQFNHPWGSLTSVSSVAYDGTRIPVMEQRIHEEVSVNDSCKGLFLWDEYAVRKLGGNYLYLPDVEPIENDPAWKMPENGNISVGSVGQLWGYRSINLLAEILSQESQIRGYASGVLKPDSFSLEARLLLEHRRNFSLDEGFVSDDFTLNERIKNLDAFVLDSRSYKCPSGLGIRAMAMGRPIIAIDTPSWISTLIHEEGVGLFWQQGEGNLAESLRQWYSSGGSYRSMEAARRLSDQAGLEEAYSVMFERLQRSVENKFLVK